MNLIFGSIFSLFFLIAGILLYRGKVLFLLAGNILPEEEQKNIDGKRLGKIIGIFLITVAAAILTLVLSIHFRKNLQDICLSCFLLITLSGTVIVILLARTSIRR